MATSWLKKTSALLALCMMLGSFSGCNGDGSGDSGEGTSESGEAVTSEAEETAVKVGYILSGECDDGGYSSAANVQRMAAAQHSNVQSYFIDNVNITDFPEAVKRLEAIGCTYIISGSWLFSNMLSDVAGKNMDLNFISHGARVRTVNVYAYTDQMYEGSYVAGMAAAYNSEAEKIGMVVDPGMLYPTAVINAAALGTQLVYKDAELVTAFASKPGEIRDAVDALKAKGCDVIISYTESAETVSYCDSIGMKVIGNLDYGANAADYDDLLMYYYADHDSFYLAQFKQMQLDTWQPEEYVGTLANGVVSISSALPAAKEGTQDIVSALVPKISNGQAYIFSGEIKDNSGNVRIMQSSLIEPSEIYSMGWYVQGVTTLETFVVPITTLEPNDFDIES